MDLVDYSQQVFASLEHDLQQLAGEAGDHRPHRIPVSALLRRQRGRPRHNMPWYEGPTLLEYLETVPVGHDRGRRALPSADPARHPP